MIDDDVRMRLHDSGWSGCVEGETRVSSGDGAVESTGSVLEKSLKTDEFRA